jgi:aspartate dehydrogenase
VLKLGIIGCGFIGTTIGGAVEQMEGITEINLIDLDYEAAVQLSSRLSKARVFRFSDMEGFVKESDLVVEAASQKAVQDLVPSVVESGTDVMIISVGALVDDELWNRIRFSAFEKACKVYVPSGAVAGIDGLFSGSMADIDCVTLTVRKPPRGLSLPPELHHLSEEMKDLKEPVVLFEGPAREAVKMFPKNVNVGATVSLAGIGFDRTLVGPKEYAEDRCERQVRGDEGPDDEPTFHFQSKDQLYGPSLCHSRDQEDNFGYLHR